uniref:Uncharacterized protein n=1 Tax=viral metagenome TaxID=1070528 RepID=A0A6M3LPM4_9ZZZZ
MRTKSIMVAGNTCIVVTKLAGDPLELIIYENMYDEQRACFSTPKQIERLIAALRRAADETKAEARGKP